MAQLVALFQADPSLTACLLRRVAQAVDLNAVPGKAVGVGSYDSDRVLVRKRPVIGSPLSLAQIAEDVRSPVLLVSCHGVGERGYHERDTAPFRFRRWLFAGAGRVEPLGERAQVLDALPEFLRRNAGGSDPELAFLSTLGHVYDATRSLDLLDIDPRVVAGALGRTMRELDQRAEAAASPRPKASAVVTNGRMLVAMRRGLPLSYALVEGLATCEACGVDRSSSDREAHVRAHRALRAVVVTSRVQGDGLRWIEVPDCHVLTVTRSLEPGIVAL